jgi:hypothetical protein
MEPMAGLFDLKKFMYSTSFWLTSAGLQIRAEEIFGELVLFVLFRAALCGLGTQRNAEIAGAVGPTYTF